MSAAPVTAVGSLEAPHRAPTAGTTRSFALRAEEVPAARRFVRSTLDGHPAADDAELLACELATNVVRHATDAAVVTVSVQRRGAVVHVDVIDDGTAGLPHWREVGGHSEGGRGFHLVNQIAYRWGFLREPEGTCVWFELRP